MDDKQTYWSGSEYIPVPEFPYPTEIELLQIFPESKSMIKQKIAEWEEIKAQITRDEVAPRLAQINTIADEFSRNFWIEAYKHTVNPKYIEALNQLERLKRLQILSKDNKHSRNLLSFEQKKELAKLMPITSLYLFQKLKKLGGRHTALCPFHAEKTPSFILYPNNTFHCFGCSAHGSSIDFYMKLKQVDFKNAVSQMAGGLS